MSVIINTINHTFSRALRNRRNTKRIIIHHSAGNDVPAATIHQWHRQRNWAGIGYHFVIRQNGSIETGRPENTIGAHAGKANNDSIGICLTGNFETSLPAGAQITSLVGLIRHLQGKYGAGLSISGHSDHMATACPGKNFPMQRVLGMVDSD